MLPRKRSIVVASIVLLAAMIWGVSGCSNSPSPTESSSQVKRVRILQRPQRGKTTDRWLTTSERVSRDQGGVLTVGNNEIGHSTLTVSAGAIAADTTITMAVPETGDVAVEFAPEGLVFDPAARLALSYKGADLTGVDEATLRIYYSDPVRGWVPISGSRADAKKSLVYASLSHFSQYAVGSEE